MNRTLILLIVFLILGGGTAWYLLNKEDDKTTLAGLDRDFAVENVAQIHKIFLANRADNSTTLLEIKAFSYFCLRDM